MLQEKQARHSLFIVALQVGGVLRRLPPPVLATLFEHAQMLAAAACVLDYQRDCGEAASGRDAAVQGKAVHCALRVISSLGCGVVPAVGGML